MNTRLNPHRSRPRTLQARRLRGFTLIEVLVVLLLFSVGLLGLVGLQAKAMQVSVGSEDSTRAALLANELASQMWGGQCITVGPSTLTAWKLRLANPAVDGLPNGAGTVTVASGVATITVTWRAPQEPVSSTHQYVTQVVIPVATAASAPCTPLP
jgi:type IV pilus assembly protein PilV